MTATMAEAKDRPEANYFRDCPRCGGNDGYLNVGKTHWFVCHKHKTRWCVGFGLFSSWMDETREQHEENAELLVTYEDVDPWEPPRNGLRPVLAPASPGALRLVGEDELF